MAVATSTGDDRGSEPRSEIRSGDSTDVEPMTPPWTAMTAQQKEILITEPAQAKFHPRLMENVARTIAAKGKEYREVSGAGNSDCLNECATQWVENPAWGHSFCCVAAVDCKDAPRCLNGVIPSADACLSLLWAGKRVGALFSVVTASQRRTECCVPFNVCINLSMTENGLIARRIHRNKDVQRLDCRHVMKG